MTTARVQVVLDIDVGGGAWGDEATVAVIRKQATEDALNILRRGVALDGLQIGKDRKAEARIVGEPKVIIIMHETVKR